MGKRGPRPDPNQAAKGFPGRRKAKARDAAENAARLAELLSPTAVADVDLPGMLQDPKYAPAALFWRRMAPELRRTHRLPVEAEFNFMRFCIYAQEWVDATDDLHTHGFGQEVATVAGGVFERRRPAVFDRQQANQNLETLSAKFGLTAMESAALFKGTAAAAAANPGMFGGVAPPGSQPGLPLGDDDEAEASATPAAGAGQTQSAGSRVGGLAVMRSAPPKPN